MRMKDKVAVITGGGSGIGLAAAQDFINEGASVVISGRNSETLDAAAAELGENAFAVPGDITKSEDLKNLFSQTNDKFGKIDALLVNAGSATMQMIGEVDEASFDAQVDINFKGSYFTIKYAIPFMNNPSSVVIVSTVGHLKGVGGFSVYSAAKGAVRTLARTLSAELLVSNGIRVNVLSPGAFPTPFFGKIGATEEQLEEMTKAFIGMIPAGRFGEMEEIAKAATYMCSSESSFMVGEEIIVDGGMVNL